MPLQDTVSVPARQEAAYTVRGLSRDEAVRLRLPFPPGFIKSYTSGKAVFRYITARDVMDRLDDVIGPSDWATEYRLIDAESFAVECRLTVRGITRADVGYPNNPELPEEKEREKLKAAYSDALKRAAVHFGIGRFLYGSSSIEAHDTGAAQSHQQGPIQARTAEHPPNPTQTPAVAAPRADAVFVGKDERGVAMWRVTGLVGTVTNYERDGQQRQRLVSRELCPTHQARYLMALTGDAVWRHPDGDGVICTYGGAA